MAENTAADRFIEALGRLEAERDLESMIALFGDSAEIGNNVASRTFQGKEGAREFWTTYRDTFHDVRSTFHNRIVTGERAALEWTTEGTTSSSGSSGGAPFQYDGVSILEIEGDEITRFRAYFDGRELGKQIEHDAPGPDPADTNENSAGLIQD